MRRLVATLLSTIAFSPAWCGQMCVIDYVLSARCQITDAKWGPDLCRTPDRTSCRLAMREPAEILDVVEVYTLRLPKAGPLLAKLVTIEDYAPERLAAVIGKEAAGAAFVGGRFTLGNSSRATERSIHRIPELGLCLDRVVGEADVQLRVAACEPAQPGEEAFLAPGGVYLKSAGTDNRDVWAIAFRSAVTETLPTMPAGIREVAFELPSMD